MVTMAPVNEDYTPHTLVILGQIPCIKKTDENVVTSPSHHTVQLNIGNNQCW